MKSYTDIVFDIDGTLLDTERTGVYTDIRDCGLRIQDQCVPSQY